MYPKSYHAVNLRFGSFLICLPFANRASVSSDLYIDFNRNHLLFPVALLDFQVEVRFNHSFPNHAYASHPAYHTMFMYWLFTMLCASFRCCFFRLVPITSRLWGTVRLCPFVFFRDSFFFLAGSQARWSYPRNHFYLCLLDARSFAMPMLRYLPLAYHATHIVEPSL